MCASPQKENGYIPIATEIFDHLCLMRIPGEVRQVVDVVIRKTYGFQKKEDKISNGQFCEMTGLKKQTAYRALSKAISHCLVIKSDDKFSFNKDWEQWKSFKKVIKNDYQLPVIQSDNEVIKSDDDSSSKVMDTIDNINTLQKIVTAPPHPDFDVFWKAYPRRVAKCAAEKAFKKINPDQELLARMLAAIQQQNETEQWKKDGGKFIPHPATWLNQKRWEDELISSAPNKAGSAPNRNISRGGHPYTPDEEGS